MTFLPDVRPDLRLPPTVPGEYHLAHAATLTPTRGPVSARAAELNTVFRQKILATDFPCVAAKASMNTSTYALGVYGELGSLEASLGLAHDLGRFVQDQDGMGSDFTSMIAAFDTPADLAARGLDEHDFEQLLWQQRFWQVNADKLPSCD